jgi:hypothetical protein
MNRISIVVISAVVGLVSQTGYSKTVFPRALELAGGAESGGGGNAVACRDQRGALLSAELQDLFEARIEFELNIPKSTSPYAEQFAAWKQKVDLAETSPFPSSVGSQYLGMRADMTLKVLPSDVGLGDLDDSQPVIVPKGCKLERLALYDDRFDTLFLDSELWGKLDETDRAALLVHESVYHSLRTVGETTSDRTRYLVGWIASDQALVNLYDGIDPKARVRNCSLVKTDIDPSTGSPTAFHIFAEFLEISTPSPNDPGRFNYTYQFYTLNHLALISKKTFQWAGPDLEGSIPPGHIIISGGATSSELGPKDQITLGLTEKPGGTGINVEATLWDGFFPHEPFQGTVACRQL